MASTLRNDWLLWFWWVWDGSCRHSVGGMICWFNLPLALGFAKLVEMWYPDAFLPALVVGYWLSNVVGIVLMQSGAMGLLSGERTPDRGRELLVGLLTSSLYTVAVFGLVRMGWLRVPLDLLDAVSSGHAV